MYRSILTIDHTEVTRNTSHPTPNLGQLLTALADSAILQISLLDVLLWFISVTAVGRMIHILISKWAPVSETVTRSSSNDDTNEKDPLFENAEKSAVLYEPVHRCYTPWVAVELADVFIHTMGISLVRRLARPHVIPDDQRKAIILILLTMLLTFFECVQLGRPTFWLFSVFLGAGDVMDKLIHDCSLGVAPIAFAIVSVITILIVVVLFYTTLFLCMIAAMDLTSSLLDVLQISHPRRRHLMHVCNDYEKTCQASSKHNDYYACYDHTGCIKLVPKSKQSTSSVNGELSIKPAQDPSYKYGTMQIPLKSSKSILEFQQNGPQL